MMVVINCGGGDERTNKCIKLLGYLDLFIDRRQSIPKCLRGECLIGHTLCESRFNELHGCGWERRAKKCRLPYSTH